MIDKNPERIKNSGNPGAFNYERYAAFQQVFHNVFLKENNWVKTGANDQGRFKQFIFTTRDNILSALRKNIGSNGDENNLPQSFSLRGLIVDQLGQIYVADNWNHQIMRWCEGDTQGSIVVGGNGKGNQRNQLNYPVSLSFDDEGNLYVADHWNHRIQKFEMN